MCKAGSASAHPALSSAADYSAEALMQARLIRTEKDREVIAVNIGCELAEQPFQVASTHLLHEAKPLRGLKPDVVEKPEQSEILTRDGRLDSLDTQFGKVCK